MIYFFFFGKKIMVSIKELNFKFVFILYVVLCVQSFIINLYCYQNLDDIFVSQMMLGSNFARNVVKHMPKTQDLNEVFRLRHYSQVLSKDCSLEIEKFIKGIAIYNSDSVERVYDYGSLKLLYSIDQSLLVGDKKKALIFINEFLLNSNELRYNNDFGKTKDQIGAILRHYDYKYKIKITPLEILEYMGYDKSYLLSKGILETTLLRTKTCVCSTVLEILVMDALPGKYEFVQKVYLCQGKNIQVNYINGTNQKNPDYIVEVKVDGGNSKYYAFDSKAQQLDTFYKNLDQRGFSYQVLTISSTPDNVIMKHDSFIKEELKCVQQASIQNSFNLQDMPVSPLVPIMFISTKDIANNVIKVQARNTGFSNKINEQEEAEDDVY